MKKQSIPNYEGRYSATDDGRIYSHLTNRFLKQQKTHRGYMSVHLFKNGVSSRKRVHRLVAKAFISNPNEKEQINHIDGNKENNRVENLEWCTRSENAKDAYENGLMDKTKKWASKMGKLWGGKYSHLAAKVNRKLSRYDVNEIRERYKNGDTQIDIAKDYDVSNTVISLLLRGKTYKDI